MDWYEVKTKTQKERLIKAVLGEIKKLKNSPALKDVIGNLRLARQDWARGGWHDTLEIDRNGNLLKCYCGLVVRWCKLEGKELERIIEWMRVLPQDIIKARKKLKLNCLPRRCWRGLFLSFYF